MITDDCKVIPLRNGYTLVDWDDWDLIRGWTLFVNTNGYVDYRVGIGHGLRVTRSLHVFLMGMREGRVVDHINGNQLDNRRRNLRFATLQQNRVNARLNRNNTSGVRGVIPAPGSKTGQWDARIWSGGQIHLGRYATLEEAVLARRDAELTYFGELCPTNRKAVDQ